MELASVFCDGLVLQANKTNYIFGYGKGEVKVGFCGKTYAATAGGDKWIVALNPETYKNNLELVVYLNGERKVIKNVAVGEVYLVAGQSNAQLRVGEEICGDDDYPADEDLRFFAVNRPEKDDAVFLESDGWQSVRKDTVKRFSAIAYHTGAQLRKKLGVVVGMVECYQGASVIQSWLKKSSADKFEGLVDYSPRKATSAACGYFWNENGFLYERMFSHIIPFAFARVIWYQGESNGYLPEATIYGDMLKTLITEWRADLKDENLPFSVVVICDMVGQSEGFTALQNAQRKFDGVLSGVTLVESSDVCEHSTIHPNDKRALSVRLAEG